MALYTVRSERMFCEQLDYNLLFRWFLDLNWDEPSFDHSSFSRNHARLLEHDVAGEFFRTVVAEARELKLTSDEHFTVDGTLIEAWASLKSLRPKGEKPTDRTPPDDSGNPSVHFHCERRQKRNPPVDGRSRGWRRRAPAKRPGSVTPKACRRRIATAS
jgi:hypothetical protein